MTKFVRNFPVVDRWNERLHMVCVDARERERASERERERGREGGREIEETFLLLIAGMSTLHMVCVHSEREREREREWRREKGVREGGKEGETDREQRQPTVFLTTGRRS